MDQAVDLRKPVELGQVALTIDDVRQLIAQSRIDAADHLRPINIQIDLGASDGRRLRRRDEGSFRPFRLKLVWVVVALSLAMAVAYARTRYVCQSFKDSGRFFYGMGVDRCVGVLITQPFDQIGRQLDTINRSY